MDASSITRIEDEAIDDFFLMALAQIVMNKGRHSRRPRIYDRAASRGGATKFPPRVQTWYYHLSTS